MGWLSTTDAVATKVSLIDNSNSVGKLLYQVRYKPLGIPDSRDGREREREIISPLTGKSCFSRENLGALGMQRGQSWNTRQVD